MLRCELRFLICNQQLKCDLHNYFQLVDGIATPLIGYEADQTIKCCLCDHNYGRCKSWHLIGKNFDVSIIYAITTYNSTSARLPNNKICILLCNRDLFRILMSSVTSVISNMFNVKTAFKKLNFAKH